MSESHEELETRQRVSSLISQYSRPSRGVVSKPNTQFLSVRTRQLSAQSTDTLSAMHTERNSDNSESVTILPAITHPLLRSGEEGKSAPCKQASISRLPAMLVALTTKPVKPPKPKFHIPQPKPDIPYTLTRMEVCPVSPMDFVNHMDLYPASPTVSTMYVKPAAPAPATTQHGGIALAVDSTPTSEYNEREFIEVMQLNIVAITRFIDEFNMSVRSRLATMNSKLANIERNVDHYEKMERKTRNCRTQDL